VVEIVTLTGTLTDTAENGETTVSLGNVVDQLLNEDSLSDTGTSEKSNLTTTGVWSEEIDDLDTGDENLSSGGLLSEWWSLSVNWCALLGVDWATLIDWVAGNVHDATKSLWTDWNHDWVAGIDGLVATDETLSSVHSNTADNVLTQVLGDLKDELLAAILGLEGVENSWELLGIELNIDDGTNDLMNLSVKSRIGAGETSSGGLETSGKCWTESSARCCCHRWADSLQ